MRRKHNNKRRWKKAILCLVALVAIVIATGMYIIDAKVQSRLTGPEQQLLPGVYSDSLRYLSSTLPPKAELLEELTRRRYARTSAVPRAPGEYKVEGEVVTLVTRPFWDAGGKENPAQKIKLDLARKTISNSTLPESKELRLEPELILGFSGEDLRASRFVSLKDIPAHVKNSVVAIEDERFYQHIGVDPIGIARATWRNFRAGSLVEGGSTLTQQLAKNLLFSPQRTIQRKVLELFAAISLEHHLSKDRILELYLNEVYLGQEGNVAVHGFPEAAHAFFKKDLSKLSISEAALLAGIIRAPSYNSPRRHLSRAIERRNTVLRKLRELDYINDKQLKAALQEKINVVKSSSYRKKAPHFIEALKRRLTDEAGIAENDLARTIVISGLDLRFQSCAEGALSDTLKELERSYPALKRKKQPLEGALIAIEPFSGKIKAWVGGRDFGKNQFDHVSQAKRQIGSTVKPFLYLTALDSGLNEYRVATAVSLLSDRPINVDLKSQGVWEPENYDREFHGDVTLRYALEHSLNVPAVYVAQRVGIDNLVSTARRFNLSEKLPAVPSLALGTADTTLLQLTNAYAGLANNGLYVKASPYSAVVDIYGSTIALRDFAESHAADEDAVFVLTNILQGVVERGTGSIVRRLGFKHPVAAKTGTSSEKRDSWFLGYTPNLAVGVWVGFDDNAKTGLTGARAAGPIWANFMRCIEPHVTFLPFIPPDGVTFADIDAASGGLATERCPSKSIVREVFVKGTEPGRHCPLHLPYGQEDRSKPEQYDLRRAAPRKESRSIWRYLFGD